MKLVSIDVRAVRHGGDVAREWVAVTDQGSAAFDHPPTDDEILAAIAEPRDLLPSALADRVRGAGEHAALWNALRDAAAEIEAMEQATPGSSGFSAQERTRLAQARDLARAALKAFL